MIHHHSPRREPSPPVKTDPQIQKFLSTIKTMRREIDSLQQSNANLVDELHQSQRSNYLLVEELRQCQRSNLNILEELQACQTANNILRDELARMDQSSRKVLQDCQRYKKANNLLKDEIRQIKTSNVQRRSSLLTIKENAKKLKDTLVKGVATHSPDFENFRQAVRNIVETAELNASDVEEFSNDVDNEPLNDREAADEYQESDDLSFSYSSGSMIDERTNHLKQPNNTPARRSTDFNHNEHGHDQEARRLQYQKLLDSGYVDSKWTI